MESTPKFIPKLPRSRFGQGSCTIPGGSRWIAYRPGTNFCSKCWRCLWSLKSSSLVFLRWSLECTFLALLMSSYRTCRRLAAWVRCFLRETFRWFRWVGCQFFYHFSPKRNSQGSFPKASALPFFSSKVFQQYGWTIHSCLPFVKLWWRFGWRTGESWKEEVEPFGFHSCGWHACFFPSSRETGWDCGFYFGLWWVEEVK